MTGDQILHALDRVASKGDAWPPTLPEFRRLAEGADIDRTDAGAVAARMPISRALPVPEDVKKHRREVAAREMKKIRELLRQ